MRKQDIAIIVSGLCLFAVVCAIYFCYAHATPFVQFTQVTDGMSKEQVIHLVGPPEFIRHDTNGSSEAAVFFYGGVTRSKFCIMEIYFGTNNLVIGKFHDH